MVAWLFEEAFIEFSSTLEPPPPSPPLSLRYELKSSEHIVQLPPGKHSTKGLGRMAPDPCGSYTDPNGLVIPMGPGGETTVTHSSLYYNEYPPFINLYDFLLWGLLGGVFLIYTDLYGIWNVNMTMLIFIIA